MLRPFARGFTVIDRLIFTFIPSVIFQEKKKRKEKKATSSSWSGQISHARSH